MWVNKALFQRILDDNKRQQDESTVVHRANASLCGEQVALKQQKSKDDVTIDWMRHRINALEKLNAQLLHKAAGIFVPVPEIVPTRPGSMTETDFSTMPSFEDVGDPEALRLGVTHNDDGSIAFTK